MELKDQVFCGADYCSPHISKTCYSCPSLQSILFFENLKNNFEKDYNLATEARKITKEKSCQ